MDEFRFGRLANFQSLKNCPSNHRGGYRNPTLAIILAPLYGTIRWAQLKSQLMFHRIPHFFGEALQQSTCLFDTLLIPIIKILITQTKATREGESNENAQSAAGAVDLFGKRIERRWFKKSQKEETFSKFSAAQVGKIGRQGLKLKTKTENIQTLEENMGGKWNRNL